MHVALRYILADLGNAAQISGAYLSKIVQDITQINRILHPPPQDKKPLLYVMIKVRNWTVRNGYCSSVVLTEQAPKRATERL